MVFGGLSFSINAGQYLSLRGRNGTGKSTLLRMIAGFIPANAGTLEITANDVGFTARNHIVLVGHLNGLKAAMTLRENAQLFYQTMTGHGLDPDALYSAANQFDMVHLLDQPVQYFSSGQRHRSALMRFLLIRRQIWLMDEPTVGLDSDNRAALATVMRNHVMRGGIIIAATHDPIDIAGDSLILDGFTPKGSPINDTGDDWL